MAEKEGFEGAPHPQLAVPKIFRSLLASQNFDRFAKPLFPVPRTAGSHRPCPRRFPALGFCPIFIK